MKLLRSSMSRGQLRVFGEAGAARGFVLGQISVVVLDLVLERRSETGGRYGPWRLGYPAA